MIWKQTPMKYLYVFLIPLLLLTSLATPTGTAAQTKTPHLKVTAAFNGSFKYGEWLPLWVELDNPGQDIEAEVSVRIMRSVGGVTYAVPVSLPAGARKRFALYVLPNNFSHELNVQLLQGEKVLASQKVTVRPQVNFTFFIGLVTAKRGALSLLNGLDFSSTNRPISVIDLPLSEIPEKLEGLRSFDVLIFNDIDTSKLTPAQLSTLQSWVEQGGRLVIGGGAGAARTAAGLPENLLPVKLDGEQQIGAGDLKDLARYTAAEAIQSTGSYIMAKSNPAGCVILVSANDAPLVCEFRSGYGSIDFIALDLSSTPFEGWSGTHQFWGKLFTTNRMEMPMDISWRSMQANMMTYPLSQIPTMELPSVQWLGGLLGLYILLVGPINYLILKKQKRLHWAWFTIPGMTILFSAAAFGVGFFLRGTNIIIHKIGIIELEQSGSAQVSSYIGLFSPNDQSYRVEVDGDGLLSHLSQDDQTVFFGGGGFGGGGMVGAVGQVEPLGSSGAEIKIIQGNPSVLSGLSVNQWSMQSFMTEKIEQDYGALSSDLQISGNKLIGRIRNETSLPLKDVTVVLTGFYQNLGDLEPGQEGEVDLIIPATDLNTGMSFTNRMFESFYQDGKRPPRLMELKQSILQNIFDNGVMQRISLRKMSGFSGVNNTSREVLIFGWLDKFSPQVGIQGQKTSQQSLGLLYTYQSYHFPASGAFDFPLGILQGSLISSSPYSGLCDPFTTSFYLEKGDIEVEYILPSPKAYRIDRLRLNLNQPDMNALPAVALFDWNTSSWTHLKSAVNGMNTIENPQRFINQDGLFHLRLSRPEGFMGGSCIYTHLGFSAEGQGGQQ